VISGYALDGGDCGCDGDADVDAGGSYAGAQSIYRQHPTIQPMPMPLLRQRRL
jgi:hypothetical protein